MSKWSTTSSSWSRPAPPNSRPPNSRRLRSSYYKNDASVTLARISHPRLGARDLFWEGHMSAADGNWKITINTPMGAQEVTASITTSGDTFTGKTSGRMGDSEVSGKVDGDTLTWSANITQPMPMTLEFTATVAGDAMTGNVKLGAFGNAPLSGVRA